LRQVLKATPELKKFFALSNKENAFAFEQRFFPFQSAGETADLSIHRHQPMARN
jgi:hypothetical protein